MQPFKVHTGLVAALDRVNVDTDQIIPKQFLKRVERTGFEDFLFYDWRYLLDGKPDPKFELNDPAYKGATILVAGRNFGCGSSREHAPWALNQYGFLAIICFSYADIFRGNCYQNGMMPVILPEETVAKIMANAKKKNGYKLTVDLEKKQVYDNQGLKASFDVEDFRRDCLMNGLDDIGLTLKQADKISAYEKRQIAGKK